MDSPRSGFRRAAVASWALAGIGIAGVAGASTLAYADTVKPAAEAPAEAAIPAPPEGFAPPSAVDRAATPDIPTPTVDPPPVPASVTSEPPPAPTAVNTETPVQKYISQQTYQQAPAPATHEPPAPVVNSAPTTKRRVTAPTVVQSPNYSPHVTLSRGS
jgi:protein TonB